MTRRPGLVKKLLLGLLVFVVVDLLLAQILKRAWPYWDPSATEARYRTSSPIYHHDLARRVDTRGVWGTMSYRMRTNSLGFKDSAARNVPLKADRHRLLIIGDSFTEGVGYEFGETFVGIVAETLERQEIEVLNAAVVSYAPVIYYRKVRFLLEEIGLAVDEVVVFLDISDIYEEAVFYEMGADEIVRFRDTAPDWAGGFDGWLLEDEPSTGKVLERLLTSNSVVIHLGGLLLDKLSGTVKPDAGQVGRMPRMNLERAFWTIDRRYYDKYGREGLERAAAHMERLASLLDRRSIPLTVAVYPWPDQVAFGDRDSLQVAFWRDWCGQHGARFVNLFPPFFDFGTPRESVMAHFIPGDIHFSRAGHEIVARRFLVEYGVRP